MPFLIRVTLYTLAKLVDVPVSSCRSIGRHQKATVIGHPAVCVHNCGCGSEFGRAGILGQYPDCHAREVRQVWEITNTRNECISKPSVIVMAREKTHLELVSI